MRRILVTSMMAAALIALADRPGYGQQIYTIGANPPGAIMYNASVAIAKVISDKLGLQMRVQPMGGSSTYLPLLSRNDVDFGLLNVDDTRTGFRGEGNFAGKPSPGLRLIAIMFPLPLSIIVPADSPVRAVKDLKGLRMPSEFPAQTTARVVQDAVLATAGLSTADMRQVPAANLFQGIDMLGQGRVDAATTGPGVAQVQQAHSALSGRGGVRFLSVENTPEALQIMRRFLPSRILLLEPTRAFPGIVEPTYFMGYNIFFIGNDQTPDDLAYRIAKMLHASRDELVAITPVLNRFDPKAMTEEIGVPWHPGAIKFYGEIGQWPPKS